MFDMRMTDFSNENYEKFSHKSSQTDLEKLKSLLDSFGVETKVQLYYDSDLKTLLVGEDIYFNFDKSGEFIKEGSYL